MDTLSNLSINLFYLFCVFLGCKKTSWFPTPNNVEWRSLTLSGTRGTFQSSLGGSSRGQATEQKANKNDKKNYWLVVSSTWDCFSMCVLYLWNYLWQIDLVFCGMGHGLFGLFGCLGAHIYGITEPSTTECGWISSQKKHAVETFLSEMIWGPGFEYVRSILLFVINCFQKSRGDVIVKSLQRDLPWPRLALILLRRNFRPCKLGIKLLSSTRSLTRKPHDFRFGPILQNESTWHTIGQLKHWEKASKLCKMDHPKFWPAGWLKIWDGLWQFGGSNTCL